VGRACCAQAWSGDGYAMTRVISRRLRRAGAFAARSEVTRSRRGGRKPSQWPHRVGRNVRAEQATPRRDTRYQGEPQIARGYPRYYLISRSLFQLPQAASKEPEECLTILVNL
jgi:hypothetical protein